jgi:lipoprotein-anchoring transpeptidase ErfK/SrfK
MRWPRSSCLGGLLAATVILAGCASGQPGSEAPPSHASRTPTRSAAVDAAADAPVVAAAPRSASSAPVAVRPTPVNHCAHNAAAQLVKVSIRAQHAWLCARTRTVFDTAITSGMVGQYTSTPTGSFRIQPPSRNTVLTLNTGAQYPVKYWVPFDAPLFGFHDSSWQRFPYGSPKYRSQGSHGCIHMPLRAMKFLYRWAEVGAHVRIA